MSYHDMQDSAQFSKEIDFEKKWKNSKKKVKRLHEENVALKDVVVSLLEQIEEYNEKLDRMEQHIRDDRLNRVDKYLRRSVKRKKHVPQNRGKEHEHECAEFDILTGDNSSKEHEREYAEFHILTGDNSSKEHEHEDAELHILTADTKGKEHEYKNAELHILTGENRGKEQEHKDTERPNLEYDRDMHVEGDNHGTKEEINQPEREYTVYKQARQKDMTEEFGIPSFKLISGNCVSFISYIIFT